MRKLLIFASIMFFLACPRGEKDAVELVPIDNEISGWVRSGTMEIAENETQLYDLIDGEGQVYVDNGFVKFVRQFYQGEIAGATREIELRIVDMGNTTNAENIYDETGTGYETPWTESGHAGVEARIDETALYDYKIDFWDDRFYGWVTIYEEKTPAGLNIAKLFAINISEAIRD